MFKSVTCAVIPLCDWHSSIALRFDRLRMGIPQKLSLYDPNIHMPALRGFAGAC